MTIWLYIFLVSFYLPLIQNTALLAEADDSLIKIQCHNANAPATCIQCLKSDNRSINADKYSIATLVIECIHKHAVSLAGNLTVLAGGISEQESSRKAYEDCINLYSQARKELQSAAKEIKNGDYDGADKDVFSARSCNLECYARIGKGKFENEGISSEMMVFEELSEATMRIIERFY